LRAGIWAPFFARGRAKKPGFPLQVLGFAYANPVGFPLQSLARLQRLTHTEKAGPHKCECFAFVRPLSACGFLSGSSEEGPQLPQAIAVAHNCCSAAIMRNPAAAILSGSSEPVPGIATGN
jgi:hypothetical protein